ncbi:MAG: hypothetical protein LBV43_14195 [Prevotella sp.]|nr:hypothetical protein [Prevotella sp.]
MESKNIEKSTPPRPPQTTFDRAKWSQKERGGQQSCEEEGIKRLRTNSYQLMAE